MNHVELADTWNATHAAWAAGEALPTEFEGWRHSYLGDGKHAVDELAMAEPWIGDLSSEPEAVTMGIHGGAADPSFHHRGGAWPNTIDSIHDGNYSAWAATGPYLGTRWESSHGVNVHATRRQNFLSAWTGRELDATQVVDFPLFPWHTAKWNGAAFTPDAETLEKYVLEPIASTGARWAFGFGKDWWDVIEALGLRVLDQLGDGGRPYATRVDHRRWLVAEGPGDLRIAVMRLDTMPIPPSAEETQDLRRVLERGPAGENQPRRFSRALETDLSAHLRELGMRYANIARLMQAIDDAQLDVDEWIDDSEVGDVALSFDGEVVVRIEPEWADFLTVAPAGSTVRPGADVHRLDLPADEPSTKRVVKSEPKPLGMCTACFNVLNPDGTCPMECGS